MRTRLSKIRRQKGNSGETLAITSGPPPAFVGKPVQLYALACFDITQFQNGPSGGRPDDIMYRRDAVQPPVGRARVAREVSLNFSDDQPNYA